METWECSCGVAYTRLCDKQEEEKITSKFREDCNVENCKIYKRFPTPNHCGYLTNTEKMPSGTRDQFLEMKKKIKGTSYENNLDDTL